MSGRMTHGCTRLLGTGALLVLVAAGSGALGVACSRQDVARMEMNTGVDQTADGLRRVGDGGFRNTWVKPGANFSEYDSIVMGDVTVAYKRRPKSSRYDWAVSNFALTDEQVEALRRGLERAFVDEIRDHSEHFRVVEEPGPATLRVTPRIIDLIVTVPTEQVAGRENTFATSAAQMTLILELFDSLSGEPLARAAERREATSSASGPDDFYHADAVSNDAAIERVMRRWASILRERLDAVHGLSSIDSPQ